MVQILTDNDVRAQLTMSEAIVVMEQVFVARVQGQTAGMPRWELPFPEGRVSFTVGAVPQGVGFRAYVRGKFTHDDQVVVVWDRQTGALQGIVTGEALGVMRTGAIGGVAAKYLSSPTATSLAIIGTGRQAFSQLLALAAVRPLKTVRVYSRREEQRRGFCQQAQAVLPHLMIQAVDSAEAAVRDAEMVVGATTSKEPVIYSAWVAEGAYVATLGTRGRSAREVDEAVVTRARQIVTDSPEQTNHYPDGTILTDTEQPLLDLAQVMNNPRPTDGLTLFLSAGLAGTEVALAAYLFSKIG